MRRIGIGVLGAGFIADTRARSYHRVAGYRAEIVAVAARTPAHAAAYAVRWSVPHVYDDYRALLDRADVDVIDICAPNNLHGEIAIAAAEAGKHIICTKPLTGYFGDPGDPDPVGHVPKRKMLEQAVQDAEAILGAARRHGVQLLYAENWVYAPAVQKALRLIEASGGTILEIRGGECHSGSHSPYSKSWRTSGGGALMRLASHPAGAALYLKGCEGRSKGSEPIKVASVVADVGHLQVARSATQRDDGWPVGGWEDIEDWGTILLTFTDGTKAVLSGSDVHLGGMTSALELCLSNARIKCQLSPTDLCQAYAPDGSVFGHEYLVEKLETSAGWSSPAPDEAWTHGHLQQVQDFVAAIAEGRPALADGELGRDVVEVIYAAYVAAEEGRRVELRPVQPAPDSFAQVPAMS